VVVVSMSAEIGAVPCIVFLSKKEKNRVSVAGVFSVAAVSGAGELATIFPNAAALSARLINRLFRTGSILLYVLPYNHQILRPSLITLTKRRDQTQRNI